VRRAQLYYLRDRRGKAARLRAKRYVRPEDATQAEAAPVEAEETKAQ
jgi:hypothetical protein